MGDLLNNLIITSVDPNDPRAEPKMRRLPFNDHIKQLLETLADVPNVANIKTVCNVLRMGVGPIIELENNNQTLLVPLIDKLRQFAPTNEYARQVVEGRDSGWCDYVPDEIDIPPSFYDISGCEQEPIFFSPAGIAYLDSFFLEFLVSRIILPRYILNVRSRFLLSSKPIFIYDSSFES